MVLGVLIHPSCISTGTAELLTTAILNYIRSQLLHRKISAVHGYQKDST